MENHSKKRTYLNVTSDFCKFRYNQRPMYDYDCYDYPNYDDAYDSFYYHFKNTSKLTCKYRHLESLESELPFNYHYGTERVKNNHIVKNSVHKGTILRNKKSNKKIKIKTLLKSEGLGSYLKRRLCDSNGNLPENEKAYDCLKYTMLKTKGNKTCLNKGKSKLHIKYNLYNKFDLYKLESNYVKPLDRCKHVFSDAYLLKNSEKKEKVLAKPMVSSIPPPQPIIQPPPPPPPQPQVEVYETPKYMYILDELFNTLPNYSNKLKTNANYVNFSAKTSNSPIDIDVTSLPLTVLKTILQNNNISKTLIENTSLKALLTLLSELTGHKPLFKAFNYSRISSSTTIKLPNVASTSNYHTKGFGYGTGDTGSIWNIRMTHWKVQTEKEHICLLLEILNRLIDDVESNENDVTTMFISQLKDSCLMNALSAYLKNSSIMDISESYRIYFQVLTLLNNLASLTQFKKLFEDFFISQSAKNLMNIFGLYLSKIKDEQLNNLMKILNETMEKLKVPEIKIKTAVVNKIAKKDADAFYCSKIKDYLFDTYKILDDSDGTIKAAVPYYYLTYAQSNINLPVRSKRIAQEIVTLSNSLPLSSSSSVFVRCDEERIDVMKVLITGPVDTPYSNGCFEFDVSFPGEYPRSPPLVILKTTGNGSVRFNPNLYNCGKVCLSVLNTWYARPEEKWQEDVSTLLQVLVSIQSLIFVPEPYFNEPGYQCQYKTAAGDIASRGYNANIIEATTKWAILEMIKNPSECFKEIVHEHFYLKLNELKKQLHEWRTLINKQYSATNPNAVKRFDDYIKELEAEFLKLKREKEPKELTIVNNIENKTDKNNEDEAKTENIFEINGNRDKTVNNNNHSSNNIDLVYTINI